MGWRSHGRPLLLRHRPSVSLHSALFPCWGGWSCTLHPALSWLGVLVGCRLSSSTVGSSSGPRPNGSASVSLSSGVLRFGAWCPGLSGFTRQMSYLDSSGKIGRNPDGEGGCLTTGRGVKSRVWGVNPSEVAEILELVRGEGNDMESSLNQMNPRLSRALVSEVLLVLNSHGASALRFFDWVVRMRPGFRTDSRIYNLMVDNLGRLRNYERMLVVLKELSHGGHCLTEKAFTFLTFSSSATAKDSIRTVVEVLHMAGGSCRGSGIYSLIKLLCDLGSFELAVFVMEETSRKTSYYNVLIAAKCRNGDFKEAYDLFDEMRSQGCDPSTKSYNYLLGSLFKNDKVAEACELLESMEDIGYHPDSVTFEVVIFHTCRVKKMDFAVEFLRRMLSDGIEPRFTTHAAFIKGYFWSGRAADAHKYVVDMSEHDKSSANMNYSLLAKLFHASGGVIEAGAIIFEMMEKNLKPNFSVYVRVTKDLYKLGRRDLASDLKNLFSKFHQGTEIN